MLARMVEVKANVGGQGEHWKPLLPLLVAKPPRECEAGWWIKIDEIRSRT
jgi:hypothetical protein